VIDVLLAKGFVGRDESLVGGEAHEVQPLRERYGVIDGDDYFLIDAHYLQAQGSALPAVAPAASAAGGWASLQIAAAADVESTYSRLLDG
jgi:hypothetical protein